MTTLATYIDHTILKATATPADIEQLCREALTYHFFAVCVHGCFVNRCVELLRDTSTQVASVVGFPLGANTTATKIAETEEALRDGASEIDMVINLGWLKSGAHSSIVREIAAIKKTVGASRVLKVILETCYLTEEEKKIACACSLEAGADYLKTSTGFGTAGATLEDVRLMLAMANGKAKVKASGGIKTIEQARAFIEIGAHRLGLSSAVAMMEQQTHTPF